MDTIGTYEVYNVLSKHKIITAFHKFYTLCDYEAIMMDERGLNPDNFMVSTGISESDLVPASLISLFDDGREIAVVKPSGVDGHTTAG